MNSREVAEVVDRCRQVITRGAPTNMVPTAKEWLRALERFDRLSPDLLGDRLLASFTWWPSVADVLSIAVEITSPARRVESCCENGWVQVAPWPKLSFVPCPSCTPAGALAAYAAGDPGWWSK